MWNQDGGPSCHTEHPAWGWRLGSGLPASAALKEERKRQEGLRHPVPPVPTQQCDSRGEPAGPPPPPKPPPPPGPPPGPGGAGPGTRAQSQVRPQPRPGRHPLRGLLHKGAHTRDRV